MIRRFEENNLEWQDRAERLSSELERSLRNRELLNRRSGVHHMVVDQLDPMLRLGQPLRIADLGTGAADIPRAVAARARELQCPVLITAVDRRAPALQIAEKLSEGFPEIRFECADILDYTAAKPFDIVLCNSMVHRFDEIDAIRLLRRCRELAEKAVMVTDLRRSRLTQAAVFAATQTVYRDPMTRHDARLAAERAFSFGELHKLAISAGWWGFHHRRRAFFRQSLWMEYAERRR